MGIPSTIAYEDFWLMILDDKIWEECYPFMKSTFIQTLKIQYLVFKKRYIRLGKKSGREDKRGIRGGRMGIYG